jgi:hypothetical protein
VPEADLSNEETCLPPEAGLKRSIRVAAGDWHGRNPVIPLLDSHFRGNDDKITL